MRHLAIGLCAFTVACGGATPTAPSAPSLASHAGSLASTDASSAVPPRFNVQVILRGDGFGLVTLRQEKDPTQNILFTDVWVRDLLPNGTYDLQRAVDTPQDGVCTGTNWLTLGQGTTPQSIVTDERGTGRAELWRAVPLTVTPSDIHFRVIQSGTSHVALHSDCFKLLLRD